MKVLVLAFDGLEHDYVEQWRLDSLKQSQYGKLTIPSYCYVDSVLYPDYAGKTIHEPYTPYVWASFLTGVSPRETGLTHKTLNTWNNGFLQFLRLASMRLGLGKIRNKGFLARKLGYSLGTFSERDHKHVTVVSHAENPVVINFPTLTREWSIKLPCDDFETVKHLYWRKFDTVKDHTVQALEQDWDLLLSYTKLLDIIGELSFGTYEMRRAYFECDNFTRKICETVDDTVILVVSDHGMTRFGDTEYGKHSDHAFYSLNTPTKLEPTSILDFYKLIKGWLAK